MPGSWGFGAFQGLFSKVQRSSGSGLHLAPGVMSLFPTAAAVDAASTGRPNLSQGGLAFLGAGPRSGDRYLTPKVCSSDRCELNSSSK